MITQSEYEKAKFIIHQFEEQERIQGYMDADEDDDGDRDWEEDERDREDEERAERAATCRCGAWVFRNDGSVAHVADCFCGAD